RRCCSADRTFMVFASSVRPTKEARNGDEGASTPDGVPGRPASLFLRGTKGLSCEASCNLASQDPTTDYRENLSDFLAFFVFDLVVLPVNARSVGPEILDGVVFARLRVEDVRHQIAVVLHDPARRLVTLDRKPDVAAVSQRRVDLFGDGVDLPAAGAGSDDEEVVQGRDAPHVQNDDVASLVLGRHFCTEAGAIQRGQGSYLSRRCELQETSF